MGDPGAGGIVSPAELKARLDAPRGQDPWNGGPRWPLRRHLSANHNGAGRSWFDFYASATDGHLRVLRAQAWDANTLDALAMIDWEAARRAAGVTEAEARSWL